MRTLNTYLAAEHHGVLEGLCKEARVFIKRHSRRLQRRREKAAVTKIDAMREISEIRTAPVRKTGRPVLLLVHSVSSECTDFVGVQLADVEGRFAVSLGDRVVASVDWPEALAA